MVCIDTSVGTANGEAGVGARNTVSPNHRTGAVTGWLAERERVGVGGKSRGREPAECITDTPGDAAERTEWSAFTAGDDDLRTRPTRTWSCRCRLTAAGQGLGARNAGPAACRYLSIITHHLIHWLILWFLLLNTVHVYDFYQL